MARKVLLDVGLLTVIKPAAVGCKPTLYRFGHGVSDRQPLAQPTMH
jgi:hypothetical protein